MSRWETNEKELFSLGICLYNKDFHSIRCALLPKKSTGQLIEYYYLSRGLTPRLQHRQLSVMKATSVYLAGWLQTLCTP